MSALAVDGIAREVVALGRNYRHAVMLRRHVRKTFGTKVPAAPIGVIGDAIASLHAATWARLAFIGMLLVVAVRARWRSPRLTGATTSSCTVRARRSGSDLLPD